MNNLFLVFLITWTYATVANAEVYRPPRLLALQMAGVEVQAKIDKVVLESFLHRNWLYENECQTKKVRHPILARTIYLQVGQKKYASKDATYQSGWGKDGQLIYRRFFNEIQYDTTADCFDYYSGNEKIKGIRLTFKSTDRADEFDLSWSAESDTVSLSKFDYEKNEYVPMALGRVLNWYE
jgi:hypothetical protein